MQTICTIHTKLLMYHLFIMSALYNQQILDGMMHECNLVVVIN